MVVSGILVIVNQNIYQGLKLVNSAAYTVLDVIFDKVYLSHYISTNITLHFSPLAGILLKSKMTKDFYFVNIPPGTILLTPISTKIECQRKQLW